MHPSPPLPAAAAAALLGLALLLPACASGDAPARTPDSADTGGWDRFAEEAPPPPPPLKGALSVPTPSVSPSPDREYAEDERLFFDAAWKAFKEDAPGWLVAREQWHALDPAARGLLAASLFRALAAARAQSAPHLAERAKKELAMLGESAVPDLVAGLSVRAVTREDGTVVPVGQSLLHDAAETLSVIGGPAVPGLMDIASSGELTLVQEAVFALGNIGDPRSEDLLLRLTRDPEWVVRGAAVLALRRYASERCRDRMVEALGDEENFVVQRAAQGLATEQRTDALPGIVDRLDAAISGGDVFRARACVWTLVKITGRADIGSDPSGWRVFIERNR